MPNDGVAFVPIKNFPSYEISEFGDIYDVEKDRWVKTTMRWDGVFVVGLRLGRGVRTTRGVGRLVRDSFEGVTQASSYRYIFYPEEPISYLEVHNRGSINRERWLRQRAINKNLQ